MWLECTFILANLKLKNNGDCDGIALYLAYGDGYMNLHMR